MKPTLLLLFCFVATFSIAQPCNLVTINTTPQLTLPECNKNDGSIVFVNTNGGNPPYSYRMGNLRSQFGSFFELEVGIYEIIVSDARACADTLTIKLLYSDIENIIKPDNAFTPNGDNINDRWRIGGIEAFDGSEVRVFNRWGQQVHQNSEYSNEVGWNGKQNGSNLPSGTYYYVISIFNNCIEEYLRGAVTIVR